jgi:uncharacterized protein YuzE
VSVEIGGFTFDNVSYDRERDVLYLAAGDPRRAVDFDESPEGHHLRYAADGELVGITVVNARWLVEEDGKIVVTLPERRLESRDLGAVIAAA